MTYPVSNIIIVVSTNSRVMVKKKELKPVNMHDIKM